MATKITKRSLLVSVLSLLVCFTMLIGTTYAWFTDSVTSTGNIIKTGTLDVSLEYATEAPANEDDALWTDASTGPIFNYEYWEPGYVQVRYVKIENEGSLDLKFVLNIIPNEAAGEVDLAEVIEVYMINDAVATIDRADLNTSSAAYKGTLASLIAENDGAAHGELADGEFEIYTIALKMSESAGNEYQNKSVGGGFAVQLLATQLSENAETDDLGAGYDEGATYPNVSVPVTVPATPEDITVSVNGMIVEVPAEVVANLPQGVESVSVVFAAPVVDATNNTITYSSVDFVDQDGNVIDVSANTTPVAVTLPAQNTFAAGETVLVYHDDVLVDDAVVNADGTISYDAVHFCEVVVAAVPDGVVARVGDALYETLAAAVAACNGGEVVVLSDVAESFEGLENVTLVTSVVGGVTITNTFAEDEWIAFNNVNIMSGVTLVMPNVLINGAKEGGSTNVIEGVLMAGTETNTTTLYQYNDARTIVRNGGQIIVSGDTVLRYNYNADSGIFIYGDGDDATVEYSCGLYAGGYIGAYSGSFYAEDAVVNTGDLRLDFKKNSSEESDKYAPINAEFVNSDVSVMNELRLYKDARLTLTASQVTAGKVQVREAATPTVTIDDNSAIKATTVEIVTGALVDAILGEDGTVSFKPMVAKVGTKTYSDFKAAMNAATNGSTVVLLNDVNADFGIVLAEGVTLDGNGFAITYAGTEYSYQLVKLNTNAVLKNVVLNNYRARTESATNGTVTLTNVTINMDDDQTGLDISRGAGVAVLNGVVCKGTKDAAHLDPSTQVQVDYTPYGDVLLGSAWELQATDCDFGSLHGWNTRNGSNVYLNDTTYTVFRMHYWPNRILYVNGVETAWAESGAIPVAHDVGGCWSVQPAFK